MNLLFLYCDIDKKMIYLQFLWIMIIILYYFIHFIIQMNQGKLMHIFDENVEDFKEPDLDSSIISGPFNINLKKQQSVIQTVGEDNHFLLTENKTQTSNLQIFPSRQTFRDSTTSKNTGGKSIMVSYLVKRFLTKISVSRRQKLFFKAQHFQILADKASQPSSNLEVKVKTVSVRQKIWNNFTNIISMIPLVYPQSIHKIIWDTFKCFSMIYFFVGIPIEIIEEASILFNYAYYVTLPLYLFLLADYFIKMSTVYFQFGQPVIDRTLILNNYFSNGMIIDGLSLVSLLIGFINGNTFNSQWIDLSLILFVSQLRYFTQIIRNFEESFYMTKLNASLLNLVKLICAILYFLHSFSCIWLYFGKYMTNLGYETWITNHNLQYSSFWLQYLEAFYYSTVTMISVGYGDVTPQNSLEKLLVIIFMFISCVQLSFTVGTVGEIINSLSHQIENTTEKIRTINKYMQRYKISYDLQYQVREYIKIYWGQQLKKENQEEDELVHSLSENLRQKLIFESNFSTIDKCSLFKDNFTEETRVKLLKAIKVIFIQPEQTITSHLEDEQCWCYIESGQLNFHSNLNQQIDVISFKSGQYFGMEEFITGQMPQLQLQSQSFVKLLIIKRSQFLSILKENPQDYEIFCNIRDLLVQKQIQMQNVCISCNCSGHQVEHCPIVHFQPDRERIIKAHQYEQKQQRKKYQRNPKRLKNQFYPLNDLWFFEELCQIIRNSHDIPLFKFYELNNNRQEQAFFNNAKPSESIYPDDYVVQSSQSDVYNSKKNLNFILHPALLKNPKSKRVGSIFSKYTSPNNVKIKFVRCVKKVIKMLAFKVKSKQTQITPTFAFNQMIHNTVENYFNCNILVNFIQKHEFDNLYFVYLRCKLINNFDQTLSKPFEVYKEYKQYFIHNNLWNVIFENHKDERYSQNHIDIDQKRRKFYLSQKLINFMFFPQIYLQKYFASDTRKNTQKQQKSGKESKARELFNKYRIQIKSNKLKRQNAVSVLKIKPFQIAPKINTPNLTPIIVKL
ncbi:hypothetical protein pb186bvf_015815 [Paramecium bursaria]